MSANGTPLVAPSVVLLMGVSGSGKTTVGKALAAATGWDFLDADTFHNRANVEKMTAGIALTDADRMPWLDRLRSTLITRSEQGHRTVLACSALKAYYRERLLSSLPDAFTICLDTDEATLRRRIALRADHFMPASLLRSQLEALELPSNALRIDSAQPVATIVSQIIASLPQQAHLSPA